MIYQTREEQVKTEYTNEVVIRMIETKYQQRYDPNSNLDASDQLLACESLAETTPINDAYNEKKPPNENANVIENGNNTYRQRVNFELTPDKLQIILQLKKCRYFTPPFDVARLLEEFFKESSSKSGHWLYIAQIYPPRGINWNLNYMVKAHLSGRKTFQNWAAYFTKTVKFRKKRKGL